MTRESSSFLDIICLSLTAVITRRKSDIENERLPPELINPEDVNSHFSNPSVPGTPGDSNGSPAYPFPTPNPYSPSTPGRSGATNGSAGPSAGRPFRPNHVRQQSLGTTATSPSNRRRSIESTISLIREAAEGGEHDDPDLANLADQISNVGPPAKAPAATGRWHGRGPSA